MAWAYSVNPLCHSVINDFQFVISATVGHIQLKFNIWIRHIGIQRSNSNLVQVQGFLTELFPFNLGNKKKFSVSVLYRKLYLNVVLFVG